MNDHQIKSFSFTLLYKKDVICLQYKICSLVNPGEVMK